MPELSDLVVVTKPDEPKLRIRRETLAEHMKLGWTQVVDEPEAKPTLSVPKKTDK